MGIASVLLLCSLESSDARLYRPRNLGTEKGIDALVDFLYSTVASTRTGRKIKRILAPLFDDEPEVDRDNVV